mmetsp:Transcript_41009/g.66031  ORF Transcript_41009/g.66031 Transcript_41009/m.66031 type:complete len:290 (+) Transcript_41009:1402-2271(+)
MTSSSIPHCNCFRGVRNSLRMNMMLPNSGILRVRVGRTRKMRVMRAKMRRKWTATWMTRVPRRVRRVLPVVRRAVRRRVGVMRRRRSRTRRKRQGGGRRTCLHSSVWNKVAVCVGRLSLMTMTRKMRTTTRRMRRTMKKWIARRSVARRGRARKNRPSRANTVTKQRRARRNTTRRRRASGRPKRLRGRTRARTRRISSRVWCLLVSQTVLLPSLLRAMLRMVLMDRTRRTRRMRERATVRTRAQTTSWGVGEGRRRRSREMGRKTPTRGGRQCWGSGGDYLRASISAL